MSFRNEVRNLSSLNRGGIGRISRQARDDGKDYKDSSAVNCGLRISRERNSED